MSLDQQIIARIMKKYAEFSGAVNVQQDGEIIFAEGFGYANRSDQVANTIDTRFGIASGTKLLTGVAICQLVEQGKLTFEARLQDVVDVEFPNFDPAITVHHLLTHTSGAPDYFDEETLDAQDDFGALWIDHPTYTIRTPRDFLPMFQNEKMKFSPGERFSYNNGGFILLGLIIEEVSGRAYTDYVTENVLKKAGMEASGFFAMDRLPERTALGYIDENDSWRTNIFEVPIIGGPDGGVFVTAPDFGLFWDALFANKLLSEELTDQFLHPHVAVNPGEGDKRHYGCGVWMIKDDVGIIRYYAVGADPGVSFVSTVFPESQAKITIISNTDDGAWHLFNDLVALV